MSGQDLIIDLQSLLAKLNRALVEMTRRGRNYAQAEHNYLVALAKKILQLRAEGIPATISQDVCRGEPEIAARHCTDDSRSGTGDDQGLEAGGDSDGSADQQGVDKEGIVVRDMNEIEQRFNDAYKEKFGQELFYDMHPQYVVGIYVVDFVLTGNSGKCFAIEIDGHEYHKSKEQREHDYNRERYLLQKGYVSIRFTGTEVYLDPSKCVDEMFKTVKSVDDEIISIRKQYYEDGVIDGCDAIVGAWNNSLAELKAKGVKDDQGIVKLIRDKIVDADKLIRGE